MEHRLLALSFSAVICMAASSLSADVSPSRGNGLLGLDSSGGEFSGYYLGAALAMGSGRVDANTASAGSVRERPFDDALGAGLVVGYNWQYDAFLIGLEGRTLAFADLEHNGNFRTFLEPVYEARVRSGFAAEDFLVYGALGLSVAKIDSDGSDVSADGWNASVGVEYNLNDTMFVGLDYTRREINGAGGGITIYEVDVDTVSLVFGLRF